MKLSTNQHSEEVVGLYAVDLNGQCALGCTADEVALLLESEQFADAKVYRIVRVQPDGDMELQGVSNARFQMESAMLFEGRDSLAMRRNFDRLVDYAVATPAPCRAVMHLLDQGRGQLSLALIYPAEYDHEMGQWLDRSSVWFDCPAQAGASVAAACRQGGCPVVERYQFWPASARPARRREELHRLMGIA